MNSLITANLILHTCVIFIELKFVLHFPFQVCGALVAVTVTTLRKAVTIVLSFMLFSKPFTVEYVWAGLIVLLAIYLNLYR